MRGAVLVVVLLATSSASGGQSAPASAQEAGTAALSGVVSDAVTGRPVAGASVSLLAFEPGAPESPVRQPPVMTDPRGRFVFVNLSSTARYTLIATRAGYAVGDYQSPESASTSVLTRMDESLPIMLADGEWKRDADIRMWRLGAIGGRVVDERGEPVVGATVRLFSRRLVAGRQQLVPGPVVTTDDRGVYRIAAVEPGRYFVAVLSVQATMPASAADAPRSLPIGGLEGRGSRPPVAAGVAHGASIDVDGRHRLVLTSFATPPPPGADRPRAYAPVFHTSARTPNEAQAIDVAAGLSRADIDFQLEPVATGTVSGRVSGAAGEAANLLLRLMAAGTEHLGFGSEVATTIVEADGSFTFLSVPAGDYTLLASPAVPEASSGAASSDGRLPKSVGYGSVRGLSMTYPAGQPSIMWWRSEAGAGAWGRMPVSVGAGDVTGLDLALQEATSVRGRLVFDDPEPPDPGGRFPILLEPANGDPSLGVPNAFTTAGDETYGFEIGGLHDGRYLARLISFFGRTWRISSVTAGGVDVTDTGFDGSLGRDYDDVVVTLSRTGADLAGSVRNRDGRAASGVVLLFPVESSRWRDYGLTPDRLKSYVAGADGAYSFNKLPDGDYDVIAVPASQSIGWKDPDFLAAAASSATRITLRTGVTASQDLRVTEVVVR